MKTRIFILILLFTLLFSVTSSVGAQTYSFRVEREDVDVYWNSDGTMAIRYEIHFLNGASASPIDFVDIGMPNSGYSLSGITAEINGKPVERVSHSSYVSGIEVALGSSAIPRGERGVVTVFVPRVIDVLFTDDEKADYASGKFSPNWFDGQFAYGETQLTVTFHLPPGVQPGEGIYHLPSSNWPGSREPEAYLDNDGRVSYTWYAPNANGYTQYTFGTSFPARYVPEGTVRAPTIADRLGMSVEELIDNIMAVGCFGFIGFMVFGMPIISVVQEQRRKMQYLPPKISIEGHGIKRGLTAVEAAILLETPLDKVMTMILFGTLKKGAAEVTSRKPLKLKLTDPLPENLRGYERQFLLAFRDDSAAKQRRTLQAMTIELINSVSEKMKGFSRKETVAYYTSINEKAWQQLQAANTPEVQRELMEEALEWTMLDKKYDDRSRDVFQNRPIFVPTWWGRYDPVYRSGGAVGMPSSGGTLSSGGAPNINLPSLPGGDFAASVVTGVQNFSQNVIGDLGSFTSGVTQKTNPVPVSRSSGGSRSGGGGCACACACAGCACACAGGGR
jgi:hypothetical protein